MTPETERALVAAVKSLANVAEHSLKYVAHPSEKAALRATIKGARAALRAAEKERGA